MTTINWGTLNKLKKLQEKIPEDDKSNFAKMLEINTPRHEQESENQDTCEKKIFIYTLLFWNIINILDYWKYFMEITKLLFIWIVKIHEMVINVVIKI